MTKSETLFCELLQVAIGNRECLQWTPSQEEWEELYDICKKQTMVGIGFIGVKRLPDEQWPKERRFLMRWTYGAEKIKKENIKLCNQCVYVCQLLKKEGFSACILKGQANIVNYGRIGIYRSPGDIDVWTWSPNNKVKDVIEHLHRTRKVRETNYHHADCPLVGDTEVEVHYRPSWMCTPWQNSRLQRFCDEHKADTRNFNGIIVPSHQFDAVYQLVHIYRHLFAEGIGLRQILDYYMVLNNLSEHQKQSAIKTIKSLGLKRFASALMYVLQTVYAMPEKLMLTAPNETEGRFLLSEIMLAGNFGHADERITVTKEENRVKWGFMKLKRNMKFITSYPQEVVFEPLFRIYHWCWRTFKLWRV